MVNEDLPFFVGYSSFAFAHSFQHEKYSLVHKFYKDKLISNKMFSLWKNKTLFQDTFLILGKVPSNYTKYDNSSVQMQKFIIPVKLKSIYWESQLNAFTIANNKTEQFYYKINSPVIFSVKFKGIYVPKDIYAYIKEIYFRDYFQEYKCVSGTNYIECSCYHARNLGNITLTFNNIEITIRPYDIFTENEEFECTFILYENTKPQIDNNYWIIGVTDFLWENTITFNYESHQIEIYSSNSNGRFRNINNIHFTMKINIYIFIIILLIPCVIFLLYIKRNNK
jgi:hypothetical protein